MSKPQTSQDKDVEVQDEDEELPQKERRFTPQKKPKGDFFSPSNTTAPLLTSHISLWHVHTTVDLSIFRTNIHAFMSCIFKCRSDSISKSAICFVIRIYEK